MHLKNKLKLAPIDLNGIYAYNLDWVPFEHIDMILQNKCNLPAAGASCRKNHMGSINVYVNIQADTLGSVS